MNNFKITVKVRTHEPLTISEDDLMQVCWQNIIELEEKSINSIDDFTSKENANFMEEIIMNYFTVKMVYNEYALEMTDDMIRIENIISDYLRKLHRAIEQEGL